MVVGTFNDLSSAGMDAFKQKKLDFSFVERVISFRIAHVI
jgi:hypothetical protein